MFGTTWLGYFEGNSRPDCAPGAALCDEVPAALRSALVTSLGRFQLGESAGGKIHDDMREHPDPALDAPTRRSIQLYIEEEWRHSRELAMVIHALGGQVQSAHWTNGAFTACRRILGLRTKMMTLAIAEVIGIVYYRALAGGVGSPALAVALRRIADEESQHLDFQAEFFDHAVAQAKGWRQLPYRWLLTGLMFAILGAALLVLLIDHGRVLRSAGANLLDLVSASRQELRRRRFLSSQRAVNSLEHRFPRRVPLAGAPPLV
jgi:hypothetical protein